MDQATFLGLGLSVGSGRMRTIPLRISLVFLHVLVFSGLIFAQVNTGTIYGTVVDPSGGAIPGAAVILSNEATGATRTVTTDSTGRYEAPGLAIGEYTLTASEAGFQQTILQGIVVHIGDNLRYDMTLQVGEVQQSVTITAAPELLQQASAEVTDLIEEQRVVDLPLNRREYISLALLSGGSTDFSGTSTMSGRQVTAPLIMVAGQRENYNTYRLNGTPLISVALGTLPMTPSIDSIQEFQIITTGASAEHGLHIGGDFLIATKSGANRLRGTLYEFLRNDVLDAKNFLDNPDLPIPKFRRNQYGLSLGGPIRRDQTFWFGNFEGLREVKAQPSGTTVPSEAARNGDFSALLPGQQIVDPFTGSPYPGNIIPPSQFNPFSKRLLERMPRPNRVGATNFAASPGSRERQNQVSARLDHHFSESDTLWGTFGSTQDTQFAPFPAFQIVVSALPPPGFGTKTRLNSRSASLHETHIFSPTLINDFRFGYTRTFFEQTEEDQGTSFGIQGATTDPSQIGSPEVAIVGFGSLGASAVSDTFTDNLFDWADSVTWVKGKHTLKFGGEFVRLRDVLFEALLNRGAFVVTGAFTGNPFADFLVGVPTVGLVGQGNSNGHNFQWWGALYAQDEWRVTPSLTLNLGLRYNYFSPWSEEFGQKVGFDTTFPGGRLILGCKSLETCPSIMPGGLDGVPFAFASEAGWPENIREAKKTDFAPRFGFAWSPTEKFVLRGGYSIFYGSRYALQSQGGLESPPFQNLPSGFNAGLLPFETFLTTLSGIPSGFVEIGSPAGDSPMTQQRSLGIQYSPSPSLMLEAQYLGSNTVHLDRSVDVNPPTPGTTPIVERSRFPKFGRMGTLGDPIANANYNAMIVRAVKRPTHGLTFSAAWTWSHSIDDTSLDQIQSGVSFRPQDSTNLKAEKGNSNFDHRHRFVLSTLYDLPIGAGSNQLNSGFWGSLLGYWKIGTILTFRSGQYSTVSLGFDNSGTDSQGADRPNLLCDPNKNAPQDAGRFFNTACFEMPAAGTFGTAGRNIVRGPGLANLDLALYKDIPLGREATRLEFRAEFFNITNHPNFLETNRIFGSPGFGSVTRVADAREIQFGLKLHF